MSGFWELIVTIASLITGLAAAIRAVWRFGNT